MGIFLYIVTFVLEFVLGIWLRLLLAYALVTFMLMLAGIGGVRLMQQLPANPEASSSTLRQQISFRELQVANIAALILGFGPALGSLAALAGVPGGAGLTRWSLHARAPIGRERDAVAAALAELRLPGVTIPRRWYVIDGPASTATVVGATLYLERDLIASDVLQPVLAHALGHANSIDGRLTLALRRFSFPGVLRLARVILGVGELFLVADYVIDRLEPQRGLGCGCWSLIVAPLLAALGGGIGVLAMSPIWNWYWRRREYACDRYAYQLGQAPALADVLEEFVWDDCAMPWNRGLRLPPTELRIDRLDRYAAQEQPSMMPLRLQHAEKWIATVLVLMLLASLLVSLITQEQRLSSLS